RSPPRSTAPLLGVPACTARRSRPAGYWPSLARAPRRPPLRGRGLPATNARAPWPPGSASDERGSVGDNCAGNTLRPLGSALGHHRSRPATDRRGPAAYVLEERPAALGVLLRARAQCQEDLLALLVDAPCAEHRLTGEAGAEPLGNAIDEEMQE